MNALKATLGLVVFVFGAMSSAQAWAWHDRGHPHFGVYIGAPGYWYSPYYDLPYYPHYYPPVVIAPSSPPAYIEQEAAQPAPAQSDWWYYCADSKAYYPYVTECPAGWQRVAPRPPS